MSWKCILLCFGSIFVVTRHIKRKLENLLHFVPSLRLAWSGIIAGREMYNVDRVKNKHPTNGLVYEATSRKV